MDRHTDSHFVGRLTVVETGRRRRWTAEEKRRIVEESRIGDRQASATARRYGIPISLLFRWRRDFARVETETAPPMTFLPVMAAAAPGLVPADDRIEIVLGNGRRLVVGSGVDRRACPCSGGGGGTMIAAPPGVGCGWRAG